MREMMPFMCSAAARDSSSCGQVMVQYILVQQVTVQQVVVQQDLVGTCYGGVHG